MEYILIFFAFLLVAAGFKSARRRRDASDDPYPPNMTMIGKCFCGTAASGECHSFGLCQSLSTQPVKYGKRDR